jgi:tetratricopeptide (TPR) repeat protein
MKQLGGMLFLLVLLFAAACTNFHVAGQVAMGREALLQENPKSALAHFRQAAEINPDFYLNWSLLEAGVWTYVGRAYYATGDMGEARAALEKATSRYSWDNMAKLYLGLALLRQNDQARGLKEIDAGLQGLYDWINYVNNYQRPDGSFWDPGGFIKQRIEQTRALVQAKDVNVPEVIAAGEYIGWRMEKEMDFARRQRLRCYTQLCEFEI